MKKIVRIVFAMTVLFASAGFFASQAEASCVTITRDLKRGSTGTQVTALQNFLVDKGFITRTTANAGLGIFGPKTLTAVIAYQRSIGLPTTGFVGSMTRGAIEADSCVDNGGGVGVQPVVQSTGVSNASVIPGREPVEIELTTERTSNTFSQADSIRFFVTARNNTVEKINVTFPNPCGVNYKIGTYNFNDTRDCRGGAETILINPLSSFVWQFTYFPRASGVLAVGSTTLAVMVEGYGTSTAELAIVTTPPEQLVQTSSGSSGSSGSSSSGGSSGGGSPTTPPGPNYNTTFKVFDGVGGYTGQVIPFSSLVNRAYVGWAGYFFANGASYTGEPDEAATRAWARSLPQNAVAIPNIESWPVHIGFHSQSAVTTSINRYIQVFGWIRSERPDLKIGVYSIAPISDYTTAVHYGRLLAGDPWAVSQSAAFTANYNNLVAASDFMRPIADAADYVYPSIYTHLDNRQEWVYYAQETIKLAQRYGKPVYPFIWPRYKEGSAGGLGGQHLPLDYWRLQMDTVKNAGANGFVVWDSGWRPADQGGLMPWENFAWIAETEDFLNDNLIRSAGGAAPSLATTAREARVVSMFTNLALGVLSLTLAGIFIWLSLRKKRLQ